jgi:hypothetical protein
MLRSIGTKSTFRAISCTVLVHIPPGQGKPFCSAVVLVLFLVEYPDLEASSALKQRYQVKVCANNWHLPPFPFLTQVASPEL